VSPGPVALLHSVVPEGSTACCGEGLLWPWVGLLMPCCSTWQDQSALQNEQNGLCATLSPLHILALLASFGVCSCMPSPWARHCTRSRWLCKWLAVMPPVDMFVAVRCLSRQLVHLHHARLQATPADRLSLKHAPGLSVQSGLNLQCMADGSAIAAVLKELLWHRLASASSDLPGGGYCCSAALCLFCDSVM
jgi:hypothetical protein